MKKFSPGVEIVELRRVLMVVSDVVGVLVLPLYERRFPTTVSLVQ